MKQDMKNLLGMATYQMSKWIPDSVPVRGFVEFTAKLPYDNVSTLVSCYTPSDTKVHVLCTCYEVDGRPTLKYKLYDRDAAVKHLDPSTEISGQGWSIGHTHPQDFISDIENSLVSLDKPEGVEESKRVLGFSRFKRIYESTKTVLAETPSYRISAAGGKYELDCVDPDLCAGLKQSSVKIPERTAKYLAAYMQHGAKVFDEHCALEMWHVLNANKAF